MGIICGFESSSGYDVFLSFQRCVSKAAQCNLFSSIIVVHLGCGQVIGLTWASYGFSSSSSLSSTRSSILLSWHNHLRNPLIHDSPLKALVHVDWLHVEGGRGCYSLLRNVSQLLFSFRSMKTTHHALGDKMSHNRNVR